MLSLGSAGVKSVALLPINSVTLSKLPNLIFGFLIYKTESQQYLFHRVDLRMIHRKQLV
jgi:hypothetical protein